MEGPFRRGARLAEFRIATTGGRSVGLRDFEGRPALFYGWGSWHPCRGSLPAIEGFARRHGESVAVASIAFDAQGPELPMRYYAAAGCEHLPLIDATCVLSRVWGVKDIPFWVLINARRQVLGSGHEFAAKSAEGALRAHSRRSSKTAWKKVRSYPFEYWVQQCGIYLSRAKKQEAILALAEAAKVDPGNRLLRPQMLAIQHPEKFYEGAVDWAWVESQIRA